MIKLVFKIFILCFLVSCGLFETRTPEEPETGKVIFPPAVSRDILLTNFIKSINTKNIDAYVQCFSDSINPPYNFKFYPSADALGKYGSVFDSWTINDERRYFTAVSSALPLGVNPILTFKDSTIAFISVDSTVFIAEYMLDVQQNSANVGRYYRGKLKLTMSGLSGGVWKILRWSDAPPVGNDTIKNTWSVLKAQY